MTLLFYLRKSLIISRNLHSGVKSFLEDNRKLSANHRTRLLHKKYFSSGENKKSSVPILYSDLSESSFIYFGLKSSIFFKGDVLLTTGSYKHPRSSEKLPSENCTFRSVFNELF
jgi:hypothetical protein